MNEVEPRPGGCDDDSGTGDAVVGSPARALLRIVKGNPDPDDLAVLAALVAAAGGGEPAPDAGRRRGGWSDPGWVHRRPLVPGPNAWRSALR